MNLNHIMEISVRKISFYVFRFGWCLKKVLRILIIQLHYFWWDSFLDLADYHTLNILISIPENQFSFPIDCDVIILKRNDNSKFIAMAALSHLKNKKESRLRDGIDKVKTWESFNFNFSISCYVDHAEVREQSRREYLCKELSRGPQCSQYRAEQKRNCQDR